MKIRRRLNVFNQLQALSLSLSLSLSEIKSRIGFWLFFVLPALVFSSLLPLNANAANNDNFALSSPYTWCSDGTGDFFLPDIAENTAYISPSVSVKGTIASVTATWDATGPAAVWVSADGGLHYSLVVNGVPLVSGFARGETLKWKAVLGAKTVLSKFVLAFTTTNGIAGTFGEPALSGFLYRKQFRISGSSAGALYNYQVLVRVGESVVSNGADVACNGHILADFNDVRFTLADGETLLPYALVGVEGKKPYRTAFFFIRVPQIPQQGIPVYLYYGNPIAKSLSSSENTFDFYEDFTALNGTLDPKKWSVTLGTGGSARVTREGLMLDAATVTARAFEFRDGIIEYVASAQTGYETRLVARDPEPASATDATLVAYASGFDGAQHCLVVDNIVKANDPQPIAAGTYYGFRLIADRDNHLTFERHDEAFLKKEAAVSYEDKEGPQKGFLALNTTGLGLGRSLTIFRWIRCRKYATPEPVVDPASLGFAEEATNLPVFFNTTLDSKKDLVLETAVTSGYYIFPESKADYAIRIIVPTWEGRGAGVDVSADGGKSYQKNCVNDSHYYASKGDFSAGEVLRSRINLRKEGDVAPYVAYVSFSCRPGNIVLLTPNGGDAVTAGLSQAITWTAWDYEPSYPMKLEYSRDAGRTYQPISEKAANTGSYFWTVPSVTTDRALVKISDAFDGAVSDASDRVFSIGQRIGALGQATENTGQTSEIQATAAGTQLSSKGAGISTSGRNTTTSGEQAASSRKKAGTSLYEIALKIGVDPTADNNSYRDGDIVMVKPVGYAWGAREREEFQIVKVYLTAQEAQNLMSSKRGAGGRIIQRRQYKIDVAKALSGMVNEEFGNMPTWNATAIELK